MQTIFNAEEFRHTMSYYPTGVAVVTLLGDEQRLLGITINSFTSLSLDPPSVLFCLRRALPSVVFFTPSNLFFINVLSATQQDLADNFAKSQRKDWDNVGYSFSENGTPFLNHTVANFHCCVSKTYLEGDHVLVLGEIKGVQHDPNRNPLIFHKRAYTTIEA